MQRIRAGEQVELADLANAGEAGVESAEHRVSLRGARHSPGGAGVNVVADAVENGRIVRTRREVRAASRVPSRSPLNGSAAAVDVEDAHQPRPVPAVDQVVARAAEQLERARDIQRRRQPDQASRRGALRRHGAAWSSTARPSHRLRAGLRAAAARSCASRDSQRTRDLASDHNTCGWPIAMQDNVRHSARTKPDFLTRWVNCAS